MEPQITIQEACRHLKISEPYFRKFLTRAGLRATKVGKKFFYTREQVSVVASLLEGVKNDFYYSSKYRNKALQYLENVPAGYVATMSGLSKFLDGKCSALSLLVSIDTVYEEEITHNIVVIGLTNNHVFVTEETDEETDERIRSLCLRKEDVERLKKKKSREVFTPVRCAG